MFIMLIIFLLVLMFNILPSYSNHISNMISKHFFKPSDEELNIRSQIKDLKAEQESVSMADEFAKYMKLQRKIDKNLSEIKALGNPRKTNIAYVKLIVKAGIYICHTLVMLSVIILLRSEPLLLLPEDWFTPLNKLVSLPTGVPGGLGVCCWILVCNVVIYRGKHLLYLFNEEH